MELPPPFRWDDGHIRVSLGRGEGLFTTRAGGTSTGPWAGLNLGGATGDEPAVVAANREEAAALAGGRRLALGRQVHGTAVALDGEPEEADGQLTADRGRAPAVLVADCVPVLATSPHGALALHCGWRGLAGGIVGRGIAALLALGEGEVAAAVGPGAGPCCYEVGDEVRAAFAVHGSEVVDGRNLDLKAIARRELAAAGAAAVHDTGICTICSDPALFFSHRRDAGVTGRQAGIAWLS